MHSDQTQIDEAALSAAIAQAAPGLAHLPLQKRETGGTENHMFRLGSDHSVRLPQRPAFAEVLRKEARWLPAISPHLPLATTTVTHTGTLGDLPFLIQTWVPGQDADAAPPTNLLATADRLASTVHALQALHVPADAPTGSRGGPLATQNDRFQTALQQVRTAGLANADRAGHIWQRGLEAPTYDGPPRWLHGDLTPANLITQQGKLVGVIDWGCLYVGDPAYDLIPAWFLLDAPARARFRDRLHPDPATWDRARARVVWQCVCALPYYIDTNPVMVRIARRGLAAAMEDTA